MTTPHPAVPGASLPLADRWTNSPEMAAALLGQAPEARAPMAVGPGLIGQQPVQLKPEKPSGSTSTASSANQTTASTARPGARDEMWQHVIGEASETVGKLGRVKAPLGVRLRKTPDPAGETIVILPFDTLVHVERKTQHGWCYVVALGDARGDASVTGAGFVEGYHLALDPPEPQAHLHWVVESGLQRIAEQHYDTDNWGSDARLYVEAIFYANQGSPGVKQNPQKLSGSKAAPGTTERTQQIWNSVEVLSDHAIWIPSPEFVEALRSQGAISSGSMSYEAWEGAKAVASEFVDWAKYGAGFVVGVIEGAYGAARDLVMGVAELFDMVFSIVKALVTEGLDALRQFGNTLYEAFKNAPELLQQLGSDFATKWTNPNSYDRGGFHGEVVGYVLMQALLLVLTLGSAASIQLGGQFAKVVQVVRALDAAADPLVYASKLRHLAKLPPEAVTKLRKALGGASDAGDAMVPKPGIGATTSVDSKGAGRLDSASGASHASGHLEPAGNVDHRGYVDGDPTTHAHEAGHGAFELVDEYVDPNVPSRATPTSPGESNDDSVMGNYWVRDANGNVGPHPNTGLRDRHLSEIATDQANHGAMRPQPPDAAAPGPRPKTGDAPPSPDHSHNRGEAAESAGEQTRRGDEIERPERYSDLTGEEIHHILTGEFTSEGVHLSGGHGFLDNIQRLQGNGYSRITREEFERRLALESGYDEAIIKWQNASRKMRGRRPRKEDFGLSTAHVTMREQRVFYFDLVDGSAYRGGVFPAKNRIHLDGKTWLPQSWGAPEVESVTRHLVATVTPTLDERTGMKIYTAFVQITEEGVIGTSPEVAEGFFKVTLLDNGTKRTLFPQMNQ